MLATTDIAILFMYIIATAVFVNGYVSHGKNIGLLFLFVATILWPLIKVTIKIFLVNSITVPQDLPSTTMLMVISNMEEVVRLLFVVVGIRYLLTDTASDHRIVQPLEGNETKKMSGSALRR